MQCLPDIFDMPHQHFIGSNLLGNKSTEGNPGDRMGAYWYDLNYNSITVSRADQDTLVSKVRIRIWVITSVADYSSCHKVYSGSRLLRYNGRIPVLRFVP